MDDLFFIFIVMVQTVKVSTISFAVWCVSYQAHSVIQTSKVFYCSES